MSTSNQVPTRELKQVINPAALLDGGMVKTTDGVEAFLNQTQKWYLVLGALTKTLEREEADRLIKGEVPWPEELEQEEQRRVERAEVKRLREEAFDADPIPNPRFRDFMKRYSWDKADEWFSAQPLNRAQQSYLRKNLNSIDRQRRNHSDSRKLRKEVKKLLAMARGDKPFPPEVAERQRVFDEFFRKRNRVDYFKP